MKQNEQELQFLKDEINQMWKLVISQVERSKQALLGGDTERAEEVIGLEKRVDAFDLKMDSLCEHYIALYSPVAIDLRLVLSIMKISLTLERIADYAVGIARYVADGDCAGFFAQTKKPLEIESMFENLLSMLTDSQVAFNSENARNAGKILAKDRKINEIYRNAFQVLNGQLQKEPAKIDCGLKMILTLQKMERIGDHCSNIVEEIAFYTEAKILKHKDRP